MKNDTFLPTSNMVVSFSPKKKNSIVVLYKVLGYQQSTNCEDIARFTLIALTALVKQCVHVLRGR